MTRIVKKYDRPGEYKETILYDKVGEQKGFASVMRATRPGVYRLRVEAVHTAPGTGGRIVVRGIARNGAQVELSGMIKIEKTAQKTDNYLELRMLLLDDKSRATVEPLLEIKANEVKAGHAASVSKIDEEQVLYLMSRGVSREEAEEQIIEGWLSV